MSFLYKNILKTIKLLKIINTTPIHLFVITLALTHTTQPHQA